MPEVTVTVAVNVTACPDTGVGVEDVSDVLVEVPELVLEEDDELELVPEEDDVLELVVLEEEPDE
jgi:hypothetical protein